VATVLRIGGLRVAVYPHDHRPAHVHVIGAGREAIFRLNCPDGPPELRANYRFGTQDLNRIASALNIAVQVLCEEWQKIHGDY
jgi:hypothetical protein